MNRSRRLVRFVAVGAATVLMIAVLATAAQAALKHFDGTVVAKSRSAKTFQVSTQSGRKVTFQVNSKTVFERIGGFGSLRKGMAIQVDAVRTRSGLLAKKVEPGSGGGSGGGNDGAGHT